MLAALTGASVALACLAACTSSPDPAVDDDRGVLLSIGDSYAAGFRPGTDGQEAENTTDGFAWKVAAARDLRLANVACSGITAVDFVTGRPCEDQARASDRPDVEDAGSEGQTVLAYLDDHAADVELVTVVLGGNDIRTCTTGTDWRSCATTAMTTVQQALDVLLGQIRDRVGPDVPIVGLTYPNVLLAEPVLGVASEADATASLDLFRDIVNPALEDVYARHGARLADVTADFGAYLPVDRTVELDGYGRIPERAATICRLTYYCQLRDLHPNPAGHEKIAALVESVVAKEAP